MCVINMVRVPSMNSKEREDVIIRICSICKEKYRGFGNNAEPINDGVCCDKCNRRVVIPERIRRVKEPYIY